MEAFSSTHAPPPSSFTYKQPGAGFVGGSGGGAGFAGVGAGVGGPGGPLGHARPRPRPSKGGAGGSRESAAVRASVFEVAMDLGITSNNLVAEWMFSNTLQEEDEEAAQTPELTHRSSGPSDDLNSSTSTFSSPRIPLTPPIGTVNPPNAYGVGPIIQQSTSGNGLNGNLGAGGWNANHPKPTNIDIKYIPHDSKAVAFPGFGGMPAPSRPTTPGGPGPSKTAGKKKRFGVGGGDGDDSDGGGYLSDGNVVRSRKQSTKEKKEEKARLKEEKREAKEAAKEEKKRKKSLGPSSAKGGKKNGAEDTGYETDSLGGSTSRSPFKSRSKKEKDKDKKKKDKGSPTRDQQHEYETDAGYASASSKKSKSRFFGLGSKSSKGDMRDTHGKEVVPPMPNPPPSMMTTSGLPVLPPIASKFATSLGVGADDEPHSKQDDLAGRGNAGGDDHFPTSLFDTAAPAIQPFPTSYPDPKDRAPMLASPPKHEPLSVDVSPASISYSSPTYTPATTASTSTPTASNAAFSATSVQDRSSLSSADTSHTTTSSMSSNSRRRGYQQHQFSPPSSSRGESMASHSTMPSVSTISSTAPSSMSMAPSLGHKTSVSTLNSASQALKPPSIYLPHSRSTSPSGYGPTSPVSPSLQLGSGVGGGSAGGPIAAPLQISKHSMLPSLDTNQGAAAVVSRGPSPMPPQSPPAPGSPYVTVTPSEMQSEVEGRLGAGSRGVSPLPGGPEPRLRPPMSPMGPPSPVSPNGFMPAGGAAMSPPLVAPLSPNGRSTSPMPNLGSGRISPNPLSRRRVSPLNLEQDVGQGGSLLPGPNVLAYYDIPPPSPPPVGPLPSVPPAPSGLLGAASQLRSKVMERQRQVPDLNGLGAGVTRGKQSPFPTRPVVSPPPRMFAGMYGSKKSEPAQEKRVRIISKPLDAFSSAGWEDDEDGYSQYQQQPQQEGAYRGSLGYGEDAQSYYYNRGSQGEQRHSGLAYDDDETAPRGSYGYEEEQQRGGYPADVGEEEMQEVLDRFADASVYGSSEGHGRTGSSAGHGEEGAVARGGSFEALRSQTDRPPYNPSHAHTDSNVIPPPFSQLPSEEEPSDVLQVVSSLRPAPDRDSEYFRDTMYRDSEYFDDRSIYSRVSILDPDQSEEARDRFVKRVQAMSRARGDEPEVIPPVPKLPQDISNSAPWNRF